MYEMFMSIEWHPNCQYSVMSIGLPERSTAKNITLLRVEFL